MTPLIAELVKLAPDPEDYHWFDIGPIPLEGEVGIPEDELTVLPFQKIVIVGVMSDGSKFMLAMIGGGDSVAVGGMMFVGPYPQDIVPFTYIQTDEGLRVYGKDGKTPSRAQYLPVMGLVSYFLRSLQQPTRSYVPVATKSLINAKRKAKGKGAVLFDWHTVEIAPTAPKSEHQGGTHASPRLHDRRGHWRNTKSGKRVWVRDCKVGDASKGVVFKDYEVKQ